MSPTSARGGDVGARGGDAPGPEPPVHGRLSGRTIVVVDDHVEIVDMLGDVLSHEGALVLDATSAKGALEVLRRELVDVLVSDLQMPAMNGLELVRAVRRLPGERGRVLAIALTGSESWDLVSPHVSAGAGFDYHVVKPVVPEDLVARLVELLRHRPKKTSGALPRIDVAEPVARRRRG